jgi:hypothetical protein
MTVIDWLLDSDPSIRCQVMRDLLEAPADEVAAERAKVAAEGWGAQLLALQAKDGRWGGGSYMPPYTSTHFTLGLLRELGLDPSSAEARRAVALVREHVRLDYDDLPYFDGEVEPCINGAIVANAAYFGQDAQPIVERLLGEQMADGGWNCEQESGSVRGSFDSTINVLEGLLVHERATGAATAVTEARRRGEAYLLDRRLLRRLSTGEVIDPRFTRLAFPTWYFYDILRGLDHLRAADVEPDDRMTEAIEVLVAKRDPDGRWPIEMVHEGKVHVRMDEGLGRRSRWTTLRALRVLRWWEAGRQTASSAPGGGAGQAAR